jgi:hypothetical protein
VCKVLEMGGGAVGEGRKGFTGTQRTARTISGCNSCILQSLESLKLLNECKAGFRAWKLFATLRCSA